MNLTDRDRTLGYGLAVAVTIQTLDWCVGTTAPYISIPVAIFIFLTFKGLDALVKN